MSFPCVRSIDIAVPDSWQSHFFLTLDLDWCPDYILDETIQLLESCQAKATWFVTHTTQLLSKLGPESGHELGIHPNFNPLLLEGSEVKGKTAQEIVGNLLQFTPNAQSVRSHSLTQSSQLSRTFFEQGLKYECNSLIPFEQCGPLSPWTDFTGMVKVPHFWEDDVHILVENRPGQMKQLARTPGLKVFAFHPVHLFLNTPNWEFYDKHKHCLKDGPVAQDKINKKSKGVRDFFLELIAYA